MRICRCEIKMPIINLIWYLNETIFYFLKFHLSMSKSKYLYLKFTSSLKSIFVFNKFIQNIQKSVSDSCEQTTKIILVKSKNRENHLEVNVRLFQVTRSWMLTGVGRESPLMQASPWSWIKYLRFSYPQKRNSKCAMSKKFVKWNQDVADRRC